MRSQKAQSKHFSSLSDENKCQMHVWSGLWERDKLLLHASRSRQISARHVTFPSFRTRSKLPKVVSGVENDLPTKTLHKSKMSHKIYYVKYKVLDIISRLLGHL